MIKKELVERVATRAKIDPEITQKCIDSAISVIVQEVVNGNDVILRKFGRFYTKRTKGKVVRKSFKDSDKGVQMFLDPTLKINFLPSPIFKNKVNNNDKDKN